MATPRNINFFIPHSKPSNYEAAYDTMKATIKYQMGWNVGERKIDSITYFNNKKKMTARVGELGQVEHHYEVVAIFEAALYIICTVEKHGEPGPMILVDTKDVIEVNDFKTSAVKPTATPRPVV